ncbi:serine/threonine-protein kinase 40-like [Anopheles cruzii]|uniref:serine/threonine-protein kinase 40-like n=1 Tax=Anopheles cruzii TaxID=68878 RepID=UPI0022EC6D8A|nr:serine/threonine-protein kinase 40-like [Anopheles cruzii]
MFRAGRKQLGKRQTANGNINGASKKLRTDQRVPNFEDTAAGKEADQGVPDPKGMPDDGTAGGYSVLTHERRVVRGQTGKKFLDCEIPRFGTLVERTRCRSAGDYIIGHELGTSPGVPQVQYLARKAGTDEYYLLKILSFDPGSEVVHKEVIQAKILHHNEYTLLSMLADLDGVINERGFFSDYAFEEREQEQPDGSWVTIYTGRVRRRLTLVLDCVHAHEFCDRSGDFVTLQNYIPTVRGHEFEGLQIFYEVGVLVNPELSFRSLP